jgi:hypothetical protein
MSEWEKPPRIASSNPASPDCPQEFRTQARRQNTEGGRQNAEYRIQNTECTRQNAECRMQNAEGRRFPSLSSAETNHPSPNAQCIQPTKTENTASVLPFKRSTLCSHLPSRLLLLARSLSLLSPAGLCATNTKNSNTGQVRQDPPPPTAVLATPGAHMRHHAWRVRQQ